METARSNADLLREQARITMATQPRDTVRRRAERRARTALAAYASALNWAEGTDQENEAHEALDAAGAYVRETFGCHLTQRGDQYFQTCPVTLSHHRVGFSVGGRARKVCSLCGGDLSECEHMRGTAYLVPGGHQDLGWCRVCLQHGDCEHSPDLAYRVSVVSIVQEMELDEISLVARPSMPDARIQELLIERATLREALGSDWAPGTPVVCNRCLQPCAGLQQFGGIHS